MSVLSLALRPRRPISTVLEAPEFSLLLCNPGRTDAPIRCDWFAGARVEVTHPDGRRSELLPFGERGPEGPADDELFGHSDRERRFTVGEAAAPGTYVLKVRLAWGPALVAETSWFLEAPAPVEVGLTVEAGAPAGLAWLLVPGARAATLLSAAFGLCDESSRDPARLSHPGRVAVAAPSARGLVASAHAIRSAVRPGGRLAWLAGQSTLHLGATAVVFDSVAAELPAAASRIVGPVLAGDDGGAGVAVLSAEGRALWLLRGAAPLVRQPPPDAAPADDADEGDEDVEEDMSEEESSEDPADDIFVPGADVPPPALVASLELPFSVTHGVAAPGPAQRALLLAGDVDGGIELVHVVLDDAFAARAVGWARIEAARTIAGCDPWLALDERGLARAFILFEETGGPKPVVAAAKLAFDAGARPVYVDGIERRRLAALDERPTAAAPIVVDAAAWSIGWCVQTGDHLIGALPGREPRTRTGAAAGAVLRFALANEDRIAAALATTEGDLQFVTV